MQALERVRVQLERDRAVLEGQLNLTQLETTALQEKCAALEVSCEVNGNHVHTTTYMYMHSCSVYSKNKAMSTASTVAYCTYYLHIVHTIYRIAWTLNWHYFVGRSIYPVIYVLDKVLVNRTCTTLLLRKFQSIDLHELKSFFHWNVT